MSVATPCITYHPALSCSLTLVQEDAQGDPQPRPDEVGHDRRLVKGAVEGAHLRLSSVREKRNDETMKEPHMAAVLLSLIDWSTTPSRINHPHHAPGGSVAG